MLPISQPNCADHPEFQRRALETVKELLGLLSPDRRVEAFRDYCRYCGIQQPSGMQCQCWNDE